MACRCADGHDRCWGRNTGGKKPDETKKNPFTLSRRPLLTLSIEPNFFVRCFASVVSSIRSHTQWMGLWCARRAGSARYLFFFSGSEESLVEREEKRATWRITVLRFCTQWEPGRNRWRPLGNHEAILVRVRVRNYFFFHGEEEKRGDLKWTRSSDFRTLKPLLLLLQLCPP